VRGRANKERADCAAEQAKEQNKTTSLTLSE